MIGDEQPKPPYKSVNGIWYTKALFFEPSMVVPNAEKLFKPIFTLTIDRSPEYICARKTFVELDDPTGYRWAMKYLGDWEHWLKLMKCTWFKEAYDHWVEELEMKLRSEAVSRIREIASGDTQQALAASRALSTLEYKKGARGRPSKQEMAAELKRQVELIEVADDDAARIGLVKKDGTR